MRHFYIRAAAGVLWLLAAVVGLCCGNLPFSVLYVALGVLFLLSAGKWKKKQ